LSQREWLTVKRLNKLDLAAYTMDSIGVILDPDALCDVMIKRFHEYKRQILKILHVVTLYNRIKNHPHIDAVPRSVIFGGKAAPGYLAVKQIMKLINAIADTVNNDPEVSQHLKVAFLPDYNVSRAELIVPAADLSEQISLAGKEASGTGNMKLALNGALTIGTLDGANIEIRDRVGADNFFLFGMDAARAATVRAGNYEPRRFYEQDDELRAAIDAIASGVFSRGDRDAFAQIVDTVLGRDEYLTLADYRSYIDCQDRVDGAWMDRPRWATMSVLNTARCGFFSSDRTIRDYCREIWRVEPVRVPERSGTPGRTRTEQALKTNP
jgi:glycogen phosphorylase